MKKKTKKTISEEAAIILELSQIRSLLIEIINYNYPEKNEDVEKSIREAKRQLSDMSELKHSFGKGLELVLVPRENFPKFVESKNVIYDIDTEFCKFVVDSETNDCLISVRGY